MFKKRPDVKGVRWSCSGMPQVHFRHPCCNSKPAACSVMGQDMHRSVKQQHLLCLLGSSTHTDHEVTLQCFCARLLAVLCASTEVVRTSQREIRKGTRDLDREVLALRREEQKLILEIKAAAKTNNQAAMRVLAKSLVRLRSQIAKLQGSSANLRGVSTNLTTAAASTTVAQSMGTATAAMSKMQQQMNPAQVS